MKRIISIAACVVLAILAVSCQKDGFSGKEQTAVFSVVIPDEAQTRAGEATVSDGSLVDKLYYEVYVGSDLMYKGDVNANANSNPKAFTVEMKLVKGVEYEILFWAQKDGCNHYSWETLKAVNVSYAGNANDETRDAFFANLPKYTITDTPTTVELHRPFAQVNFWSASEDWNTTLPFVITTNGGYNLQSKVVMKNLPNCFNVSTGDIVSGATTGTAEEIVFDFSQAPVTWTNYKSEMKYNGDTYQNVAMVYILASKLGENIAPVTASFVHNKNTAATALDKVVTNVPVMQNFRTNILGNIFTGDNTFNVVVSPNFKGDYFPEN